MSIPIFYINNYTPAEFLTLGEDTSKHMIQVLRMKEGDDINLTDGKGHLLTARIAAAHKRNCTVKVTRQKFTSPKEKQASIALSLLKNATRFEWFLEKATELGVSEITPLLCDRTEKQHFRYERMNNIVIAAMLQSQQCWLPLLNQPVSCKDVITNSTWSHKLIAHCGQGNKSSLHAYRTSTSVQLLIGPEGDFSTAEIELAIANEYTPVSLGETRLRTETAGVAGAVLLYI